MAIALDASVLSLWLSKRARAPIDPATEQPIAFARERIEKYIDSLKSRSERVVVPMPALAEVLSAGDADISGIIDRLQKTSAFQLTAFGQREALELAMINRQAIANGDKKGGLSAGWQKIKTDRQIVAIAKVANVTAFHTDDENAKTVAEQVGLKVVRTIELPYTPPPQLALDLDDESADP
ncbi:MAG: hypothetical protein ACFB2Z_10690 [Maricaulaceae bacterium]